MRSDGKRHGMQLRTGPLPAPSDFGEYEVVHPGTAERLLAMAEKEQEHRHALEVGDAAHEREQEKRGLTLGARLTGAGMVSALVALLAVLGAGLILVLNGHELSGYTALVTATVAIITVFIKASLTKRQPERKERLPERTDGSA